MISRLEEAGGTDFRPAFEYVNGLKKSRQAASLKGLIYFTDGKGIYPVQAPSYDTAFVFIENMFSDESVPPWAMKVVHGGGTDYGVQTGKKERTWTIEAGMR